MTIGTIFLVLAFICFLMAALNTTIKRVSLLPLGLAFWVLALILDSLHFTQKIG